MLRDDIIMTLVNLNGHFSYLYYQNVVNMTPVLDISNPYLGILR